MELFQITKRTKDAIRRWAEAPDAKVRLDDRLSKFQNGDRDGLRVRVNGCFGGQTGFPIQSPQWDALSLEVVRDLRDAIKKIMEDGV